MCRYIVVLLVMTSALQAQFFGGAGGVASLLGHAPGIMEVTSLTRSSSGFKLAVRFDDGSTASFETTGSLEPDTSLVSQLEEGRRYAMPQHFIDHLGYIRTAAIVRQLPNPQVAAAFPPRPRFPSALMALEKERPFRATVLDLWADEADYSLVLQAADSRLLHLAGSFDNEALKTAVKSLQRGETHEFPAVLDLGKTAKPVAEAARVLGCYIGEWSGSLEDDPSAKVVMKCHWKADGTGIWREIAFSHEDDPGTLDISLITYDEKEQRFVVTDPAKGNAVLFHTVWKAAEHAFVSTLPAEAGQSRVNTATFSSDDRIDWQTVTRDAGGKTVGTRRGSYRRVAAVATARKLPEPLSDTGAPMVFSKTSSGGGMVVQMTSTTSSGQRSVMSQTTSTSTSTPPSMTPEEKSFAQLRELPPFRGQVTSLNIGPDAITTTISVGDGRRFVVHHKRDENWDLNLGIAKRLTFEETYEFPDVVSDGYSPERKEPDEKLLPLAGFIGEWRLTMDAGPIREANQNVVRYFWKNDGKGLWRETRNLAATYPLTFTSLITHDPSTGGYQETMYQDKPGQMPSTATWDAASQTLTVKTQPEPGVEYTSSRRLASPDRIEWRSTGRKADGTPTPEYRGHFDRIKP